MPSLISVYGIGRRRRFVVFSTGCCGTRLRGKVIPAKRPNVRSVAGRCLCRLTCRQFVRSRGFSSMGGYFLLPARGGRVRSGNRIQVRVLSGLKLRSVGVELVPTAVTCSLCLSKDGVSVRELSLWWSG